MPHKSIYKIFDPPDWLRAIDDTCLSEMLIEALVARDHAVKAGALQHPRARGVLNAGDETIDQIRTGRYHGPTACNKAATALRKYQQALDCMFPTPAPTRGRRAQFRKGGQ